MRRKVIPIATGFVTVAVFAVLALWDEPRYRMELVFERNEIEQAAQAYFKAEMDRDFESLYAYLAPSSTYRRTHSYEQFLEDVSETPVTIRTYRIVDIYRLRGNHDPSTYPAVSRFVQVEVDVDVGFTDTGTTSTCNYCFTFLKEGGRWYKG